MLLNQVEVHLICCFEIFPWTPHILLPSPNLSGLYCAHTSSLRFRFNPPFLSGVFLRHGRLPAIQVWWHGRVLYPAPWYSFCCWWNARGFGSCHHLQFRSSLKWCTESHSRGMGKEGGKGYVNGFPSNYSLTVPETQQERPTELCLFPSVFSLSSWSTQCVRRCVTLGLWLFHPRHEKRNPNNVMNGQPNSRASYKSTIASLPAAAPTLHLACELSSHASYARAVSYKDGFCCKHKKAMRIRLFCSFKRFLPTSMSKIASRFSPGGSSMSGSEFINPFPQLSSRQA